MLSEHKAHCCCFLVYVDGIGLHVEILKFILILSVSIKCYL